MKEFNCEFAFLKLHTNPGFYILDSRYLEDKKKQYEIESRICRFEVDLNHGEIVLINKILYLVSRHKVKSWPVYQVL